MTFFGYFTGPNGQIYLWTPEDEQQKQKKEQQRRDIDKLIEEDETADETRHRTIDRIRSATPRERTSPKQIWNQHVYYSS